MRNYATPRLSLIIPMAFSIMFFTAKSQSASADSSRELEAARPYTVKFIDEMTSHHEQGALMAQLAAQRAFHAELKNMAKMMVTDQQKEIQELQSIRMRSYPRVEKMSDRGVGMDLEKLSQQRGIQFDLAFLDSMIAHHPAAIYLGQEAVRRSGHPNIRQMGQKISSKQARELEQLRTWRDAWAKH